MVKYLNMKFKDYLYQSRLNIYETKHGGQDRVRRLCLNMFGGAVPEFMQSIFDDRLVNSGFTSRVAV